MTVSRGIDGFEHASDHAAHAAITALLDAVFTPVERWRRATRREARGLLAELGGGALEAMIKASADEQRALLMALCERMHAISERDDFSHNTAAAAYSSSPSFHWMNVLLLVVGRLLKKRHDYSEAELLQLIAAARLHHRVSTADVLGHVERHVGDGECSRALRDALVQLSERVWKKELKARLEALLASAASRAEARSDAEQTTYHLRPLTAWSRQAVSDLDAEPDKTPWRRLLRMTVEGAQQPRPTRGWQTEADALLTSIGRERVAALLVRWLELTPDGAEQAIEGTNADVLRALAWSASRLTDRELGPQLVRALVVAANACFAKVENVGARCARAANACIFALGELAMHATDSSTRDSAAAALLSLADSVSYSAAQRQIQRAFTSVATQLSLTTEALRQRAVAATAAARARPVRPADVEQARAHLGREELTEALAVLIAAWRGARVAELTEQIAALDKLVGDSASVRALRERLGAGNKPTRLTTFVDVAADVPRVPARIAAELGALLEQLDHENGRTLRAQLEALEPWPEDPRLALALTPLVANPTLNDARAWQAVFNMLRRHGDAVALQELEVAADDFDSEPRVPPRACEELAPTLSLLRGVLINTPALDEPARAAIEALAADIAQRAAAVAGDDDGGSGPSADGGDVSLEALLAAIYRAPHDDAPRRVYADVLSERGDPRGELCAIQLADSPSRAQRKRARELVAEHGRAWLGPLEPVIQKKGLEFRRGFPAAARVASRKLAGQRSLVGDPAWSTFEKLELVEAYYLPDGAATHEALRGLHTLHGATTKIAVELFGSARARSIVELDCELGLFIDDDDDEEERREASEGREAVASARGLPQLRRLRVNWSGGGLTSWRWLLECPLMRQIEHLTLPVSWRGVAELARFVCAQPSLPTVALREMFRYWKLELQRGAEGLSLHVSYDGRYSVDDETLGRLCELLDSLAGVLTGLRELRVELPRRTSASDATRARLQHSAAALGARDTRLP